MNNLKTIMWLFMEGLPPSNLEQKTFYKVNYVEYYSDRIALNFGVVRSMIEIKTKDIYKMITVPKDVGVNSSQLIKPYIKKKTRVN